MKDWEKRLNSLVKAEFGDKFDVKLLAFCQAFIETELEYQHSKYERILDIFFKATKRAIKVK